MQFVKMHGVGNDFIVIDCLQEALEENELPSLAQRLCDRHFGIGGDGLLLVLPSHTADFQMRMFNPDGSEAEMCGNGIRCFAKYVFDDGWTRQKELRVETLKGVKELQLTVHNDQVVAVRVDMGLPVLDRIQIPMAEDSGSPGTVISEPLQVGNRSYSITAVSMGNPHCVLFVDNVDQFPLSQIGPKIEGHATFPRRTNVEFCQMMGRKELRMRVWERGAGETLACGTGACASLVAAVLNGLSDRRATVHLTGGDLDIEWSDNDHVMMTGPAAVVFKGEI